MFIIPNTKAVQYLEALRANTDLSTNTDRIHLFKNDFTPGPDVVIGDFVEADFSGYAFITGAPFPTAPKFDPTQGAYFLSPLFLFTSDDPITVTNTIFGWYITTAGGVLLLCERFAEEVEMGEPNQALPLTISFGGTNAASLL